MCAQMEQTGSDDGKTFFKITLSFPSCFRDLTVGVVFIVAASSSRFCELTLLLMLQLLYLW